MAAPRPIVIVLLLVLIALVALFVVGVGVGAGGNGNDGPGATSPSRRWDLDGLRRRWLHPRSVRGEELAGCAPAIALGPGRPAHVPVMGACTLAVAAGQDPARDLTLRSSDDVKLHFAPHTDPPTPIDTTLRDGKPVKLSIQRGGAAITLTCPRPMPCAVTLE